MQGWSFNIFRLFGIRLAVHYSFFLLPILVVWDSIGENDWASAVYALLLLLAFFCCVVLHELGHSFVAKAWGIGVPRILLMPIGGMAEFDHMPREPRKEIGIALAGPAVNLLIVALLLLFVGWPSDWESDTLYEGWNGFWIELGVANAVMAAFNLIPVFPMDGGRVLRALLAKRLSYLRATFWAAMVAKVLGLAFIGIALWIHWWMLLVLFVFIIIVGELEYRAVRRAEEAAEHWRRFYAAASD